MFLLIFLPVSYSIADIKETKNSDQNNQKYTESSDLEGIHEALSIFSRSNTQDNLIYDQKRREMLDSVEERFVLCDLDNDRTLDVYETTHCLPQVARKFREVDTDNDFLITLLVRGQKEVQNSRGVRAEEQSRQTSLGLPRR